MDSRVTVFALLAFCWTSSITQQSPFRRVTLCNGTDLCASGTPSDVYDVDVLAAAASDSSSVKGCIPPNVLCSWKCAWKPNCTSFNWKATIRKCELFSYTPVTCGSSANCFHYERISSSDNRSCSTSVFSLTGDDSIGQLFIDGIEVMNLTYRNTYTVSDSVPLPPMAQLIAIRVDNAVWKGGLLGSSETFVTDSTWKLSTSYKDGWMLKNFSDNGWVSANPYAPNNGSAPYAKQPQISEDAQWIASNNLYQTVIYFRYRIHCGP